jgi:hypothetical protein
MNCLLLVNITSARQPVKLLPRCQSANREQHSAKKSRWLTYSGSPVSVCHLRLHYITTSLFDRLQLAVGRSEVGLCGVTADWIRSILTDRRQQSVCNNGRSSMRSVRYTEYTQDSVIRPPMHISSSLISVNMPTIVGASTDVDRFANCPSDVGVSMKKAADAQLV